MHTGIGLRTMRLVVAGDELVDQVARPADAGV